MPEDNPLKPTDLKRINYGIVQLENFMEKAQKLRNSVEQDDASAFTEAGKLKSGQECAHKFNKGGKGGIPITHHVEFLNEITYHGKHF